MKIKITMPDGKAAMVTLPDGLNDSEIESEVQGVIADYELQTGATPAPTEQPGLGERIASSVYPRTMQAVKAGEDYPIKESILDVASLPGRTIASGLRAWGGAEDPGYKGLGATFGESLGKTGSDAQGLGWRVGEELLRDPYTLLIPAVGGAVAKAARPLVRMAQGANWFGPEADGAMKAQGAIEAARAAAEGVAGGYSGEGDGFNPLLGAASAIPGAVAGAKASADIPSSVMRAQYTRPIIVRETLSDVKFNPRRKQVSEALSDVNAMEPILFLADRYGPAPMSAASETSISPWHDIDAAIRTKIDKGIGESQRVARGAPEFETRIKAEEPLLRIAEEPRRSYQNKEIMVNEMRQQVAATRIPFEDVMDRVYQISGEELDPEIQKEFYKIASGMKQGPLAPSEKTVSINELIEMKRYLNQQAKELGKYTTKTEKITAKGKAYDAAYDAVNDAIKANLPDSPAARDYLEAEQAFARFLPVREALHEKVVGATTNRIGAGQRSLDRLAALWGKDLQGAIGESLPPKITAGNAYRLYQEAPKSVAKAQRKLEQGSGAIRGRNVATTPTRFLYNRYGVKRDEEQQ